MTIRSVITDGKLSITAITGRSVSPRNFPVSGRSREHAEIAVAVNSRRRHQRGEAVEQLERGQALRATATGARFRRLVDEVLAVALAQPVQGERWAGAVAQQPQAPGAVGGLDAHRGVDGEAAAMLPLPHRLRVIVRQQAAAHEHAQQAPAHLCLHLGDGVGLEPGGGMENDPAGGGDVEHAVERLLSAYIFVLCIIFRTRTSEVLAAARLSKPIPANR